MTWPICDHAECANASFCRPCIDADQRKARGEAPLTADHEYPPPWYPPKPVRAELAKSTIDATIYVIQQKDPERLERWLDAHADQRAALERFIATMEPADADEVA